MKIRRRILSLAMLAVMLFTMALSTIAVESGVTPYYNNTATTQDSFVIDENGLYGIHVRGFDETDADTSNDFNGATKISPLIYTVATILKFNE